MKNSEIFCWSYAHHSFLGKRSKSLSDIVSPELIMSFFHFFAAAVQSVSHVTLFAAPWTAEHQASLPFTISWSFFTFTSIVLVMLSNHLILCHSLLLLPSIFPNFRVFSIKFPLCIRQPNYWSFSTSSSNEYWGLIPFQIDSFDLLAIQGTLKSLLQDHSLKASILWLPTFFMVWLSHLYMTAGKTIALTIYTFVPILISLKREKLRL